jgi:hypothetical protein
MRRLVYAVLLATFAASVSFSQVGPLRTGFAVVTPITGGRLALSVTETFTERFGGHLLQSTVQPSPLVTRTSIVVTSDPAAEANTGIAILDPFDVPAILSLNLLNRQGIIIGARTLIVGARQQRSRFLTELFAGVPELTGSFTGQLQISSNVPIAVLALAFSGPSFTALPATQLSVSNAADGTFFLPQVAAGAGWTSTITIANISILPQSVRIDFFDSGADPPGMPTIASSIPNIVIQPGGVVTFSTPR